MIKYAHTATANLAAYVIFRDGNKVAFVLRSNTDWMNDHYGLPSGKVEEGESFTAAAIREAREEVGITLQPENLRPLITGQRHHEDSDWVDVVFEATEWEGELINAEPDMHSEVAWLDIDNLPDNIIPGLRQLFKRVQAGAIYFEYGWDGEA